MNPTTFSKSAFALEVFRPATETIYSLEQTARLAQIPRHRIAAYFKHGLITPLEDPDTAGWYFSGHAIRTLRQVEHLRNTFGMSMLAIKVTLDLMQEVENLRDEIRLLSINRV